VRALERSVARATMGDGPGTAEIGYAAFPRCWKSLACRGRDLASRKARSQRV
jgi:hypothetical protein